MLELEQEQPSKIPQEKLAKAQEVNASLIKLKEQLANMQLQVRIKELESIATQNLLSTEVLRLYVEFGLKLEDEFDLATGEIHLKKHEC